MTDLHKIWHIDAESVSQVHQVIIFFVNPRWRTTGVLERLILHHHHQILCFNDFQDGGCPLKFLTAAHFRDTFCSNLPNFVEMQRYHDFIAF